MKTVDVSTQRNAPVFIFIWGDSAHDARKSRSKMFYERNRYALPEYGLSQICLKVADLRVDELSNLQLLLRRGAKLLQSFSESVQSAEKKVTDLPIWDSLIYLCLRLINYCTQPSLLMIYI